MANFPTQLDNLSGYTPVGGEPLSTSGGKSQSQYVIDANNAIDALEAKLGVNQSADVTSHDYRLRVVEGTVADVVDSDENTLAEVLRRLDRVERALRFHGIDPNAF